MENNNNMYNWVFRFNPHTSKWYAVHRDHYTDLFSDIDSNYILKSNAISTLIELIEKTGGDQKAIELLLKNQNKKKE